MRTSGRPEVRVQSILLAKKMDARVPQTSLRSLRKLDCVPAHDGVIRSEKIYAGASRNAFAKASRSDTATSETAQYVTPPSVQVTMW